MRLIHSFDSLESEYPQLSGVLLFLFYILCVSISVSIRDTNFQRAVADNPSILTEFNELSQICGHLPSCLRIGAGFIGEAIQSGITSIVGAFTSVNPQSFAGEGTMYFDSKLALVVGSFLYRIVALLPLLLVALLLFDGLLTKFGFLAISFLALSGWGPWIYVPMFDFARLFIDWPISWWNFRMFLVSYDYAALGFVFILLAYLALQKRFYYLGLAAVTVIGQLTFENLGLVTGVSVFLFTLWDSEQVENRIRTALVRLFVCGATTLAVLAIMITLVRSVGAGVTSNSADSIDTVVSYFVSFWVDYGQTNIQAIDILFADFLTLLAPPLLFGGAFGILKFLFSEKDRRNVVKYRRFSVAALSIALAFTLSLFVGLFVSGLTSDMGRQTIPLVIICVFLGIYMAMWILASLVSDNTKRDSLIPE